MVSDASITVSFSSLVMLCLMARKRVNLTCCCVLLLRLIANKHHNSHFSHFLLWTLIPFDTLFSILPILPSPLLSRVLFMTSAPLRLAAFSLQFLTRFSLSSPSLSLYLCLAWFHHLIPNTNLVHLSLSRSVYDIFLTSHPHFLPSSWLMLSDQQFFSHLYPNHACFLSPY